jgi:C-terminal processing protease CtpA/Prc
MTEPLEQRRVCFLRIFRRFLFAAGGYLCLLGAPAQNLKPEARLQERYVEAQKLYEQKHFAEAAAILEPFYAAGPDGIGRAWYEAMYDLACEEALGGNKEKAIEVLTASQADGGSVTADHLATDRDLASLHGDPRFERLVEDAKNQERLWAREPGQDVPHSPNLSEDAKVAGLSTVWAEARFNFAFFDRQPALDWNQLYLDYLPKVRATNSTGEYYRVLMRFAAELKDGHTNVYPPEAIADAFYGAPGLRTRLVEDTVIVTAIDDPALLTQGWRIGDVLKKIGSEDVHSYAEREVAPYQSASTPQDLAVRTYSYALLKGQAGTDLTITVEDAQSHQSVRTLKRLPISERTKFRHIEGATFVLRGDGIAVLTVNEFEDAKGTKLLLTNLPQVESAKGLIIDVRANGGGNTPFDLLQILARGPIPGALQRTRSYRAVDRPWGILPGWSDLPTEQTPADQVHHVDVPVAVLTSAMTFSAAEDFVAAFAAMHRGIIVGEKTGGSTGQPLFFHLPGGGTARVCTKNDRAGDGTVFEGIGLVPTVPVSPTVADVRSGADVVMDRAVAVLLNHNK